MNHISRYPQARHHWIEGVEQSLNHAPAGGAKSAFSQNYIDYMVIRYRLKSGQERNRDGSQPQIRWPFGSFVLEALT